MCTNFIKRDIINIGGENMEKYQLEDTLLIVKDYLDLMWCIHEKYEASTNINELTIYKLGIQTFLLLIREEIDNLKLDSADNQ